MKLGTNNRLGYNIFILSQFWNIFTGNAHEQYLLFQVNEGKLIPQFVSSISRLLRVFNYNVYLRPLIESVMLMKSTDIFIFQNDRI